MNKHDDVINRLRNMNNNNYRLCVQIGKPCKIHKLATDDNVDDVS